MALEADIYDALTTSVILNGFVGNRIYPVKVPQGSGYPAVVYRRASGERTYDMSGYSTLENAKIELAIIATAVTQRRLVADAAIGALSSAVQFIGIVIASPGDAYDDAAEIYMRTYDISIWYNG